MESSKQEVVQNKETQKFELKLGEDSAFIRYNLKDGHYDLEETFVPESLRGHNLGAQLAEQTFSLIQKEGKQIYPSCPFLHLYVKRHTHWKSLVRSDYAGYDKL